MIGRYIFFFAVGYLVFGGIKGAQGQFFPIPPTILVPAGQEITTETCPNGVVDPEEVVTVNFCVRNDGPISSDDSFIAVLKIADGVVFPGSFHNTFTEMAPGATSCQSFHFTAESFPCDSLITATLQLFGQWNDYDIQYSFRLGANGVCCEPVCGVICPNDITIPTDPDSCLADLVYPKPTSVGVCESLYSYPPSGAGYLVGPSTTRVNVGNPGGGECGFNVTVKDMQAPTIICPGNETDYTTNFAQSMVVNYPTPDATDNCAAPSVVCTPPSGSVFPAGTTTVTCVATDAANNQSTCTFTVTVYDAVLQDDDDPGRAIGINTNTGEFAYCCDGELFKGTGRIQHNNCRVSLVARLPNNGIVSATVNKCQHRGQAFLRFPRQPACRIVDSNTQNSAPTCP